MQDDNVASFLTRGLITFIYIYTFFKNRACSRGGKIFPYFDDIIFLGLNIKNSWFRN